MRQAAGFVAGHGFPDSLLGTSITHEFRHKKTGWLIGRPVFLLLPQKSTQLSLHQRPGH